MSDDDPLVAVRRDPNYARSVQFLLFFHPALPFLLPDHEFVDSPAFLVCRLEWLLAFETDLQRLSAPFLCLTKRLPGTKRFLSVDNLCEQIFKEYESRGLIAPFKPENASILMWDVHVRCQVLADLVDFLLENPSHFRTVWEGLVKDGESAWRLDPVGMDNKKYSYYVFDDGRLYRQAKQWELLAGSVTEWTRFIEKRPSLGFNKADSVLINFLKSQIFPDVLPILEDQEREERKLMKEIELASMPRKRSSRLKAIAEQQRVIVDSRESKEHEHATESQKRRLREQEADALLFTYVKPNTPASSQKTREERLRERELKKMIDANLQAVAIETGDAVKEDEGENVSVVDSHEEILPDPINNSSPLKLIFKRGPEGYTVSSSDACDDVSERVEPIVDVQPEVLIKDFKDEIDDETQNIQQRTEESEQKIPVDHLAEATQTIPEHQ